VADPGVLVSAVISDAGPPARVLDAHLAGRIRLVVSPMLLAELADVLERPKFRPRLTRDQARAYLRALAQDAELWPDPPPAAAALSPDPKDDYLILLARSCGARALVSGDHDLTGLVDPDPPVLTPRQLVDGL
jgi:putative PIN family toxin of toxin-antitoxin system